MANPEATPPNDFVPFNFKRKMCYTAILIAITANNKWMKLGNLLEEEETTNNIL